MFKKPKSLPISWFKNIKKLAIFAVVAEGLAFGGSYLFWYRLNTNRGKNLLEKRMLRRNVISYRFLLFFS